MGTAVQIQAAPGVKGMKIAARAALASHAPAVIQPRSPPLPTKPNVRPSVQKLPVQAIARAVQTDQQQTPTTYRGATRLFAI
jgi:hypothetical protein